MPSAPDIVYSAQIKPRGLKPFADADFDMMTGSTKVRAEIANPPIEPGNFGKNKLFNGLHAEAHLVTETEAVPAIPRSAVISRGNGPTVYVAAGNGNYAPRAVRLGRVGDEFCEVLDGLKEGEKVVTTGGVLIDSEAQLASRPRRFMINQIIEWSLRNRFLVLCGALLLAGFGVNALYRTPVDAIPDLSENQVIVYADWMGRSRRKLKPKVTYPLSVNLQGLAGVKAVRAASMLAIRNPPRCTSFSYVLLA